MKRWQILAEPDEHAVTALQSELNIEKILAKLFLQRGIKNREAIEKFVNPSLENLHDPFLLKNMDQAVNRLNQAVRKNERIILIGDYDVDGTTAVALMFSFLKTHTNNIEYYIPDRYTEGYGVSHQSIVYAIESNVNLIISLDCGVQSVEHVKRAREHNIDFIVCDHHNPGPMLPDGIILDPKQFDCKYPFKGLSGCGVAFKLLHGWVIQEKMDIEDLWQYLDLVAISIGADLVPVIDENRILCSHGLFRLNQQPRTAFRRLIAAAGRNFPLSLTDVVFTIAPRINAAGRLRSGKYAVELMIETEEKTIDSIALEIEQDNRNRKTIDQRITQEALQMLATDSCFANKKSTVVFQPEWHKGVVGIVASRLIEHHFKPTIVLTESNGKATGSARTVHDFDLHGALCECADLLEQFGGHRHAAGMTLALENVDAFSERFEEVVASRILPEECIPSQTIDVPIHFSQIFQRGESLATIPRLKKLIDKFEPYGPGNMKPVFLATNVFAQYIAVLKENHIKLTLKQPGCSFSLQGIGFNMVQHLELVRSGFPIDIAFTLEINRWNDKETLQLNIKDIREHIGQ
jgi:single-stranded-DNA-specific exonuclease